jgi:hypothetical protein
MRLMKVVMAVLMATIAFAVFAYTSAVRDDLPDLRPYITSEHTDYYTQETPGGKPRLIYERRMKLDGSVSLVQARSMAMRGPHYGNHGFSFRTDPAASISSLPRSWQKPNERSSVYEMTYWRELKWNEVLWVRLTHIGQRVFAPEPQVIF